MELGRGGALSPPVALVADQERRAVAHERIGQCEHDGIAPPGFPHYASVFQSGQVLSRLLAAYCGNACNRVDAHRPACPERPLLQQPEDDSKLLFGVASVGVQRVSRLADKVEGLDVSLELFDETVLSIAYYLVTLCSN